MFGKGNPAVHAARFSAAAAILNGSTIPMTVFACKPRKMQRVSAVSVNVCQISDKPIAWNGICSTL